MDHALAGPAPGWLKGAPEEATARPPRPRPLGAVLMIGDLLVSRLGRPLLLEHWDEPEAEG